MFAAATSRSPCSIATRSPRSSPVGIAKDDGRDGHVARREALRRVKDLDRLGAGGQEARRLVALGALELPGEWGERKRDQEPCADGDELRASTRDEPGKPSTAGLHSNTIQTIYSIDLEPLHYGIGI